MGKLIDISGHRFGDATVVTRHGCDSTGKASWACVCDCGSSFVATGANLKSGNTKSCGCRTSRPAFIDRTGSRYVRLTVRKLAERKNGKVWWSCVCDCGKTSVVSTAHLISKHTKSCGCLASEVSSRIAREKLGGKREAHPRWRSDLTEDQRKGLRGEGGKAWARKVKERDGFKCVACNGAGVLQSHHLTGFSVCPERREDASNGVCVCEKCHRNFHQRYGYTGFLREDFFEFAEMPDPGDFSVWGELPQGHPGNAVKYILRADHKGKPIEDLEKARWYIDREIAMRKNKSRVGE